MPKMKSHKGMKKRFRVTARGKIKHKSANAGHLLSHKSGNRKRRLRHPVVLNNPAREALIKVLMHA